MECNRKYENSTCDHMNVDIHDTMMCAATREKNICLVCIIFILLF